MKWSKEEIMAYVDGQLPKSEILRIEESIHKDSNAKNYYNSLIESNELIDITYNVIEKSYVPRNKQPKITSPNNPNEKKLIPKLSNSIAISFRGVLGVGLLSLILAIGVYQIGKNSQNLLNKQQSMEMLAMKNILDNKEIIQDHIGQNNLNDLRIQLDNNNSALVKFKARSQDKDKFCQNFIVEIEEISYSLNTCNNFSSKEDIWDYQLQKILK